jgi:polyisoprenoid-binding protein YceI
MTSSSAHPHSRLPHALLAGLGAGGLAALIDAFVASRLHSPDAVLVNSASVAVLVLFGGIFAGIAYWGVQRAAWPVSRFWVLMLAAFVLIAVLALLIEALPGHPLLNVATFCIPLAALGLFLIAALTPLLAHLSSTQLLWAPLPAIAGVVAGVILLGHSGSPAGRLALPDALSVKAPFGGPLQTGALHAKDVEGLNFVVDPSQSKATYTVHEQLAELPLPSDAVGTTSNVSGNIFLDGRPSTISVDISTFKSDQPARDRHLLFDPGLSKMGPAQFTTNNFELPASYTPGDTVTTQVQGTMKLNNVEKPMTFTVEARLADKTLSVHGASDFTWSDFNIPQPKFQQVLKIDNNIHAEVALLARAQ